MGELGLGIVRGGAGAGGAGAGAAGFSRTAAGRDGRRGEASTTRLLVGTGELGAGEAIVEGAEGGAGSAGSAGLALGATRGAGSDGARVSAETPRAAGDGPLLAAT